MIHLRPIETNTKSFPLEPIARFQNDDQPEERQKHLKKYQPEDSVNKKNESTTEKCFTFVWMG